MTDESCSRRLDLRARAQRSPGVVGCGQYAQRIPARHGPLAAANQATDLGTSQADASRLVVCDHEPVPTRERTSRATAFALQTDDGPGSLLLPGRPETMRQAEVIDHARRRYGGRRRPRPAAARAVDDAAPPSTLGVESPELRPKSGLSTPKQGGDAGQRNLSGRVIGPTRALLPAVASVECPSGRSRGRASASAAGFAAPPRRRVSRRCPGRDGSCGASPSSADG